MSYNPDSPGLEKAPSKLPSNTPPSAAQGYITVSDISQLFSRFEATQATRDAELQGQLRHEIEVLRTQVIDLSSQLHSSNAGTDSNSAGTPLNSTLNSSEAVSPPISSTPSSLGIGSYLGDEHRFLEPELSPSRYIESLVPLNVLAPKLISHSSSRCVSDIDSLIAWTRKQCPPLFQKFDDALTSLLGVHEALGSIYFKILSYEGANNAVASMCYIRLLEAGEGNAHGDQAAAIAFTVSRTIRACLKTPNDQMRDLWQKVNHGSVPEELMALPNTYINNMYDPQHNTHYTQAICDLKTFVGTATLKHITSGSCATTILNKWRTQLPTQSYDLTQSLAKEHILWIEVERAMGRSSPLEYERVLNILRSMHPDIQAHSERILNEELALEEHEWDWKTAIPIIGRAEGIVKRNKNKSKPTRPPSLDPPDPTITNTPQRPRTRSPKEPCAVHQTTWHSTDNCPQVLMQLGMCVETAHGRECKRPSCTFKHTIPTLDPTGTVFTEAVQSALIKHAEHLKVKSTKAEAAILAMHATPEAPPPSSPETAEDGAAATAAAAEEHPARKGKRGVTSNQATIGYVTTYPGLRRLWDPGDDDD
jgi:hypothetical protein